MPPQRTPDRQLIQKIVQALTNHGFRPPCHVEVTVKNGDVTLSGMIQYPNQRRNAIRTALGVPGVRRVIDHLRVKEHPIWADRLKKAGQRTPPPPATETHDML